MRGFQDHVHLARPQLIDGGQRLPAPVKKVYDLRTVRANRDYIYRSSLTFSILASDMRLADITGLCGDAPPINLLGEID